MKYLIVALLLFSCSDDEPTIQIGCMTGYNKQDPTKRIQTIWCCTRDQYLVGSNESLGGNSRVQYFSNLNWTPVKNCNECP